MKDSELGALAARLERLNDGIARPVPISERESAGEAAKYIREQLEKPKKPKKTKVIRHVEEGPKAMKPSFD